MIIDLTSLSRHAYFVIGYMVTLAVLTHREGGGTFGMTPEKRQEMVDGLQFAFNDVQAQEIGQ
ncbi:MAG: hypothetical protein ACR2OX_09775 [Methyloligellaceae bacterium]